MGGFLKVNQDVICCLADNRYGTKSRTIKDTEIDHELISNCASFS